MTLIILIGLFGAAVAMATASGDYGFRDAFSRRRAIAPISISDQQ